MNSTSTPTPPALHTRMLETLGRLWAEPSFRATALFLYYLGIIIALLVIYGRGDFTTAPWNAGHAMIRTVRRIGWPRPAAQGRRA